MGTDKSGKISKQEWMNFMEAELPTELRGGAGTCKLKFHRL
jgi:hypothetical protein